MTANNLLIDRNTLKYLTRSAPPYVYEILIESQMTMTREAGTGFVLQVQTRTRNQILILLKEESVAAILKALTQLFQLDVLRLSHQRLKRDIPVQDFLSFCD